MGLFDEWKDKSYAEKMQKTYLSDFEKGQVNKGTEIAEGLVQSVSAKRVAVLLEILGRPTTVQVDHHQIEIA